MTGRGGVLEGVDEMEQSATKQLGALPRRRRRPPPTSRRRSWLPVVSLPDVVDLQRNGSSVEATPWPVRGQSGGC
jgi:hypothetical protein